MKLIERYILRRLLVALAVVSTAIVAVLWIAQAIQRVDVLTSSGQGIGLYLQMTSLGVPSLLAAVLPISLVIALAHAIRVLNDGSELTVIAASGASRAVLLRPFLVAALVTSLIVYVLALSIGPAAMLQLRAYLTTVRADLVSVLVQDGEFNRIASGLTFHVGQRAPGGVLKRVLIRDAREEEETLTYLAREGSITKQDGDAFLILTDGQIQRSQKGSANISTVDFTSYAYSLSTLGGADEVIYLSSREIPTEDLISPPVNHPYYKRKPGVFRAELHNRLTAGLYPIAFVLIVMLLAGRARSNRSRFGAALVVAGSICVAIRGLGIAMVSLARGAELAVFAVWAVPLLAIVLTAILLATGRTFEPGTRFLERLIAWRDRLTLRRPAGSEA